MSKHNPMITAIEDVNFSKLKFEEAKPNDYSKYQDMSFANMEQTDGTLSTLYFKTPLTDYTIGGLPPAKDRDGNELFKDESERAKWRYYIDDSDNGKKMLAKMNELQDKLIKEKAVIVGKKDEKKFELENIIGESQNKEGESMYYVRFNFHTEGPTRQIATKFFVRKDGIDDEIMIKCVSDFESQFRRGEFRYRMIVSLNKVYKQKKLPGKYGVSFKVHQMLIEMRDDISSVNTKNMFATSQFDSEENISSKMEKVDLSKNIEAEADDEDDEEEEESAPPAKASKKVVVEEEEEDDDEIKPSKVTVSKAVAKAPRKKASA
jgi:hypothetical protein